MSTETDPKQQISLYSIMVPIFVFNGPLNQLRRRFDPLYGKAPSHITLVFPFPLSSMEQSSVEAHVESCVGVIRPFTVVGKGVTGFNDEWLFLNLVQGIDSIVELHRRLYSSILTKHYNRRYSYLPHVTVGHFPDKSAFEQALTETAQFSERLEERVSTVVLERIDADDMSVPLRRFELTD